jgi:hypothetical protein
MIRKFLLLGLTLLPLSTFANLGDTKEAALKRYGTPEFRLGDAVEFYTVSPGVTVMQYYKQNVCASVAYTAKGRPFTDDQIVALMDENLPTYHYQWCHLKTTEALKTSDPKLYAQMHSDVIGFVSADNKWMTIIQTGKTNVIISDESLEANEVQHYLEAHAGK